MIIQVYERQLHNSHQSHEASAFLRIQLLEVVGEFAAQWASIGCRELD